MPVIAQPADTIYFGGDILTMKGKTPEYASALAVRGGKIAYVGPRSGAMRLKGTATQMADLVVLEKNPLKVEPASIKNIQVIETIKEGTTVYKLGASKP